MPDDSLGVPGDPIMCMFEDDLQNIWLGTINYGLVKFNKTTETAIRFTTDAGLPDNQINRITSDSDNLLWISTNMGICLFDPITSRVVNTSNKLVKRVNSENSKVTKIFFDSKKNVWVCTYNNGLYLYNLKDDSINNFTQSSDLPVIIDNDLIININEDNQNGIWFVVRHESLIKYNQEDRSFNKYRIGLGTTINAIIFDRINKIFWLGTENGLILLDPSTLRTKEYHYQADNPNSLSGNNINEIFQDNTGIIWICTRDQGVSKYDPNHVVFPSSGFKEINQARNQESRYVKSITQDSRQEIWIGTDEGIYNYSPEGILLRRINVGKNHVPRGTGVVPGIKPLKFGGITAIMEQNNNYLWVSTWGSGLYLMDRQGNIVRAINHPLDFLESYKYPNMLGDMNITFMTWDIDSSLLIGTVRGIFDIYYPNQNRFEHYIPYVIDKGKIKHVFPDKDYVWICIDNQGLFRFCRKTKKSIRFTTDSRAKGLGTSSINSVTKDRNGILWFATDRGVYAYDADNDIILDKNRRLENLNAIHIVIDASNHLWISTITGVIRYDVSNNTIHAFDLRNNALPASEKGILTNTGTILLGGVNGINVIDPGRIRLNRFVPPLKITGFKLFNKDITPGEGSLLSKPLDYTRQITLKHNQSFLTFEFSSLNFTLSDKNEYQYKLENLNNDWHYLGNQRSVSFANIPPGNYVFRVKGSNNDGVWNNESTHIAIRVLPPFWKETWFRILLVAIGAALAILWLRMSTYRLKSQKDALERVVRERTNNLRLSYKKLAQHQAQLNIQNEILKQKNHLLEVQKEEIIDQKEQISELARKEREADEQKIHFFTNISHELRTPLTLITSSLESIITNIKDKGILSKFRPIQRNALRLVRLVNQILDLSMIEANALKLCVRQADIISFIGDIFTSFVYVAERKGIEYSFTPEHESLITWFDEDKVDKIIYNLLSNAFKFTTDGGSVNISIQEHSFTGNQLKLKGEKNYLLGDVKYIQICIKDSGVGIEPEEMDRIFKRFYKGNTRSMATHEGTGIGLSLARELALAHKGDVIVESEEGKGSSFSLFIPFGKMQYDTSEIEYSPTHLEEEGLLFNERSDTPNSRIQQPKENDRFILLLVEDNLELMEYLRGELTNEYSIHEAYDGNEGFEKASELIPDLIISDVMMPGMNGFELCHAIKNDEKTSHVPVILLTARASLKDQIEGIKTGADAYIPKPFSINLLRIQIQNLITHRKRLKEIYGRKILMSVKGNEMSSIDEVFFGKIAKLIEWNLINPDFGVEYLANHIGMSRSQLFRKIKSFTDLTPIEYINRFRLEKATVLLEKGYNISEVAYMVGFQTPSAFSKKFKQYYHCTPKDYLKK